MNLYCISGLGADASAFQYLAFPEGIHVIHLPWLPPLREDTMETYAAKMTAGIDTTQPFVLLGLSFGGMLATEMLAHVQPLKTILLSSAASKKELPILYRAAGQLRLNRLMPRRNIRKSNLFTNWLFSISSKKDGVLLEEILKASNPAFTYWAINAILNWKRIEPPAGIIRIHGTKDRVLPIQKDTVQYIIKNGGHFMVVNRAQEIAAVLVQLLR